MYTFSLALIPAALALLSTAVAISAMPQSNPPSMSTEVQWHDDLDAAFQIAKQSGKDVLVNFTARRQCLACELLKRQVLIQPEFLDYVDSRFVLVELDKSSLEDDDTKAAKLRRLEAWQFQYRAGSVPTVLLLDQSGRPYGITHHRGGGPTKFVEFLEQCRTARTGRDRLLGEAQLLSGQSRALRLNEALDVVANLLTNDVTLDEPPLMAFYEAEVRDILDIESSTESALHKKYMQLQQELKEAQGCNSMKQKFDEIKEAGGYEAAVNYVDELLTEAKDPSLRRQLKRYRRFYLEWAHRFEDALDETRDQLRDPELTEKERHHLEDREAFNLVRLGRRDEAFTIIDRWTVDAGDDRNQRRIAFQEKGQFHYFLKEWSEAATTFEFAAQNSDDGTDEWWENKTMSASALLFGKNAAAARRAYESLLHRSDVAADLRPNLLLRLIESLLATDDRVQADALRVVFRQAITECPKDLLPPEDAKRLLNRSDELFAEVK